MILIYHVIFGEQYLSVSSLLWSLNYADTSISANTPMNPEGTQMWIWRVQILYEILKQNIRGKDISAWAGYRQKVDGGVHELG